MRDDTTVIGEPDGEAARRVGAVGLTVVGHPDPGRVGERAVLTELSGSRAVPLSRLEPAFAAPGQAERRPLADPHLSRRPVQLTRTTEGGVQLASDGSMAFSADGREILFEARFSPRELERGVVLVLANRVVLLLHAVDPAAPEDVPSFGLVGESAGLLAVRQEIQRVADLSVAVLLRGETGTGKELVARAVHESGPRRRRPYVAVNMGGIPPTLAAAELFGAARGAYTGADRSRRGYFSRAQGGTLFLDEIGETPPEVQVLLLRVLETREIQPVGEETALPVDVRVIAATDADLERAVAQGRFRAPLLHRLNAYEIRIPPLRERRDDVGRLLVHFLRLEAAAVGQAELLAPAGPSDPLWLPAATLARLAAYDWPGNLRQLRNVVRRIVIGSRGQPRLQVGPELEALLSAEAVPEAAAESTALEPGRPRKKGRFRPPAEVGDAELVAALRANRWRIQPAAAQLGVARSSLYELIDRSALIRKPTDLAPAEIRACFEACGADLGAMAERLEVSQPGLQRRLRDLGLEPRRSPAPTAGRVEKG